MTFKHASESTERRHSQIILFSKLIKIEGDTNFYGSIYYAIETTYKLLSKKNARADNKINQFSREISESALRETKHVHVTSYY